RLRKDRMPNRRGRAVELRSLKDAKAAASIALDPDETLALARLEQIHQPAEPVAPLVESAVGLSKDLLDDSQIHGPSRVGRGGDDPSGDANAVGGVANLCRHVRLRSWRAEAVRRRHLARFTCAIPRWKRGGVGTGRRTQRALVEALVQLDHH